MNNADQDDYWKLYNRFENVNDLNDQDKEKILKLKNWLVETDFKTNEKIEVVQIYETNCFENGICIQASRFNHSCSSNAEYHWNEKTNSREIRVISKVNPGDEITVNYAMPFAMKNFQKRQEYLSELWGFVCKCDRCKEEQIKGTIHTY